MNKNKAFSLMEVIVSVFILILVLIPSVKLNIQQIKTYSKIKNFDSELHFFTSLNNYLKAENIINSHLEFSSYTDFITTFNNFGSVQIDLPSSTIQQTDKNKSIEIIIDKDGNYHISEDGKITQVQFADLDAYLKSVKEATVSADKNLKYQTIMDVITKIKENGVDNLGLTFYE